MYISKVIFVGNEKNAILLAHCELLCSWTYWRQGDHQKVRIQTYTEIMHVCYGTSTPYFGA